jgi:hypothetical protein
MPRNKLHSHTQFSTDSYKICTKTSEKDHISWIQAVLVDLKFYADVYFKINFMNENFHFGSTTKLSSVRLKLATVDRKIFHEPKINLIFRRTQKWNFSILRKPNINTMSAYTRIISKEAINKLKTQKEPAIKKLLIS